MPVFSHISNDAQISMYMKSIYWCPYSPIPALMHKSPSTWSLYIDGHILPYQQWCTNLHVHEVYILMPIFSHTSIDAQISMYMKSIYWCPYSPILTMMHKSPCTWSLYNDAHILPYQQWCTNLYVHKRFFLEHCEMQLQVHEIWFLTPRPECHHLYHAYRNSSSERPMVVFSLCVFYPRSQPWCITNSTAIPWNSDIVWLHNFWNLPCT